MSPRFFLASLFLLASATNPIHSSQADGDFSSRSNAPSRPPGSHDKIPYGVQKQEFEDSEDPGPQGEIDRRPGFSPIQVAPNPFGDEPLDPSAQGRRRRLQAIAAQLFEQKDQIRTQPSEYDGVRRSLDELEEEN